MCACAARGPVLMVCTPTARRMLRAAVVLYLVAPAVCFLPATGRPWRGAPTGRAWGSSSAERGCGIRGSGASLRLTGGKGIPEHCGGKAPGWAREGARGRGRENMFPRLSMLRVKRDGVRAGQCCNLCCTMYNTFYIERDLLSTASLLGQCCVLLSTGLNPKL